jgi:uncharacterized membrane protein
MMSTRKRIRTITVYAFLIAMLAMMGFVPFLGFISFNTVSVTIMHIPVLIGAYILKGKSGFILGFTFGTISFLVALSAVAPGPTDLLFINPLISILPRVAFGGMIGVIFSYMNKWVLKPSWKPILLSLSAFLLTVLHTFFVLLMIYIFQVAYVHETFGNFFIFFIVILGVNGFIEATLAAMIVPSAVLILSKLPFIQTFHKE